MTPTPRADRDARDELLRREGRHEVWGIVLLSAAGLTVSGAAWTNWLQMLMGVALGAASLIVLALRKPL